MQKERLTIENIKQDLSVEIKKTYRGLAAIIILLIFIVLLIGCAFKIGPYAFSFNFILVCCSVPFLLFSIIKEIRKSTMLHTNLKNTNCIVKDKLVGRVEKEHYRRYRMNTTHHLYFSCYGDYKIPDKNYKWSSAFSMNHDGVYNYAKCGDEFYLVLSESNTGKILYAYNTKMFDME